MEFENPETDAEALLQNEALNSYSNLVITNLKKSVRSFNNFDTILNVADPESP